MRIMAGLMGVTLGCSPMAIDGEVVDITGAPLAGATVTAIGTQCQDIVGDDGKYELVCLPGTYKIVISQEGYIAQEFDIEAPERQRYPAGKRVMIKVPDASGLFLFDKDAYIPMKKGHLVRNMVSSGGERKRAYCLDTAHSESNPVRAGGMALFDNESDGWRPFLLDAEGCAYRDSRNQAAKWTVEYKEKPKYEERTLERGKKIARIQLKPGDYFLADWKQGFFTQVDAMDDGKKRYSGYWIRAVK